MAQPVSTRYSSSEEWADIQPVAQDDGPDPVAPIAYSPEYTEAMDYFRAVLKKQEKSERVLRLLDHILELNPSHYTIWQYRREVLVAIGSNLKAELDYITAMAEQSPKNYQLWYHRQVIVERLQDASKEHEFVKSVLDEDAKNYHAWSYRQWLLATFPAFWDGELAFTNELLVDDIRNNSAWNHRFHVITNNPTNPLNDAALEEELKYVFEKVNRAPNNESAWNYLRGLVDLRSFKALPQVEEFCVSLRQRDIISPFLLSMLADIHIDHGNKQSADELLALLEEKVDTVRRKYWAYRRSLLK